MSINNQQPVATQRGESAKKVTFSTLSNHPAKTLIRLSAYCLFFALLLLASSCTKRQAIKTTPQVDAHPDFWIRVLLAHNTEKIRLRLDYPFSVSQQQSNEPLSHLPAQEAVNVTISNGKINIADKIFDAPELTINPVSPFIFNFNGSEYRGKLLLAVTGDANLFDAINLVPLEPYVAGVLGAEMPDYWEPQALQAQAIAIRTYSLYIKRHFGPQRRWDVTKTQANQVYLGIRAESKNVWDAVEKTNGLVLVGSSQNSKKELFPAYYCSSCGGHTEDSQNVFGGQAFETLSAVPCPFCQYVAKTNVFFWSPARYEKKTVSELLIQRYPSLQNLDTITKVLPFEQSSYPVKIKNSETQITRLINIKLVGSNGQSSFIRAEDLRCTIDPTGTILRSTIFKIIDTNDCWTFTSGRGFGHGVGLCQCGAQAMARLLGKSAQQILSYYYPNSEILYVY